MDTSSAMGNVRQKTLPDKKWQIRDYPPVLRDKNGNEVNDLNYFFPPIRTLMFLSTRISVNTHSFSR